MSGTCTIAFTATLFVTINGKACHDRAENPGFGPAVKSSPVSIIAVCYRRFGARDCLLVIADRAASFNGCVAFGDPPATTLQTRPGEIIRLVLRACSRSPEQ